MSLTEWLLSVPCRLKFACFLFILYCNVFRRLSGALPQNSNAVRQSQPFQNSRIEHRLLNPPVNPWIAVLSHLRHYLRFLVESWPARTKLRTRPTILSFSPRPFLASCLRYACHVIGQGSYSRMPLFTQSFSCFLRLTSLGTSFWLKMSSHLNVIHYCRADTASFSYFCLITRLLLFKPLDTPMFCKVEIRQNIM